MNVPPFAVLLTAAGVIPFAWYAAVAQGWVGGFTFGMEAKAILARYALTILSFMGGCIFGFAAKAGRGAMLAIAVLPALFGFFLISDNLVAFAFGFAVLLAADWAALRAGDAPGWWLHLRLPVTLTVCLCLITGAMA